LRALETRETDEEEEEEEDSMSSSSMIRNTRCARVEASLHSTPQGSKNVRSLPTITSSALTRSNGQGKHFNASRVSGGISSDRHRFASRPMTKFANTMQLTSSLEMRASSSYAEEVVNKPEGEATPIVIIDNIKDPFATVVSIQFGDYLEELIDTVAALKNLKLNIVRAKFTDNKKKNRFYVTDSKTGEKVLNPERMEEIRLTILRNMVTYHPESVDKLAVGGGKISKPSLKYKRNPLGPRPQSGIPTKISVHADPNAEGLRSILFLECADRPGLLVDVVKVLNDLSIAVVSAEVDTEGLVAKDAFYITYQDESLSSSMITLVENALSYYLNLAEVEGEESY